jgi:hypothetical protein
MELVFFIQFLFCIFFVAFYAKTEFDELLCSSKVAADVDTPTVSQTLPYFFEGLRTCGISVKSLNKGRLVNKIIKKDRNAMTILSVVQIMII